MHIVPYKDNETRNIFFNWIDFNTIKNAQCIVSNLLLKSKIDFVRDIVLSNPYTVVAANYPLRAWNCIIALHDKRYWQVALDVLAFSSLFFPLYGLKAAILIDLASEAINVYIKMNHDATARGRFSFWSWSNWGFAKIKTGFSNARKNDEMDCTIPEDALKVLGLFAEEAKDKPILDERYQSLRKVYSDRIMKLKELRSSLAKEFERLLNEVQIAYDTLSKEYDIQIAHKLLKLDPNQKPTKEEVDKAFRQMSKLSHPDRMKECKEYSEKYWHEVQSRLGKCKQQIYDYYGF